MVQSYNTNVFNPNFFGIQSRTSIFSEAAKRASCPFYTGLSAHFSYAEKSEIGIYSLTAVQLSKVHRKALSRKNFNVRWRQYTIGFSILLYEFISFIFYSSITNNYSPPLKKIGDSRKQFRLSPIIMLCKLLFT